MKDFFSGITNPLRGKATNPERANPSPASASMRSAMIAFANSGLFLRDWYLSAYPDIATAKVDPFRHFLEMGWKERRKPNPYFDPQWYLARHPDVAASGVNPLAHYWMFGEKQNRQPCALFDTEWYRETYKAEIGSGSALAHYLANRRSRRYSPNRFFDISHYLANNPDVAAADVDPFEHFVTTGYREGRSPSPSFDLAFYMRKYVRRDTRDPLTHYFEIGRASGFSTLRGPDERSSASEIRRAASRSSEFQEFDCEIGRGLPRRAKVLAFYLPQFHSFPENDLWWGKGFTEWTNIARGTPRFVGHYQPRIPRDLGFYDLSDPGVMVRQIEMAQSAGIHGFCFYYYNFNGKRLLDRPVESFLKSETKFPFCIMWANENWTRRWDGAEAEVLIQQDYRAEDAAYLIDDIARHFADPRYIRIDGRPLFLLYRADIVPDTRATLSHWRELFSTRHNERPLILMAQAFNNEDPRIAGFDGAFEFPPHKIVKKIPTVSATCEPLDDSFSAQVYRYDDVVHSSTSEEPPEFPLIKTIVPSWDNDARRQGHGLIIAGSSPVHYATWLQKLIQYARRHPFHGEHFVLVNAWNEWAEGAYLEPDVHFGGAYLNATARAIVGRPLAPEKRRVLLVGHDAFPAGAQLLLLNLARAFRNFGVEVEFLLGAGGDLLSSYEATATTHLANLGDLGAKAEELGKGEFSLAIVNTIAAGGAVPTLKSLGINTVSLVHELPRIVLEKRLTPAAEAIAKHADAIVFPAETVREAFLTQIAETSQPTQIRPQGLYHQINEVPDAREEIIREFDLPSDARIVLNIGYGDLRKGIDLFCATAQLIATTNPEVTFIWVGRLDGTCASWLANSATFPNVKFAGQREDVATFLCAADVLALTSREDPYPSVVLEALSVGTPVIGFEDAGGFSDLLGTKKLGSLVPYSNVIALRDAIVREFQRPKAEKETAKAKAIAYAKQHFAFDTYAFDLMRYSQPLAGISVIVPNFNYAKYLHQRLTSIFDQSYPVLEIIVLDDASVDASIDVIDEACKSARRTVHVVRNKQNSGSPFAQWRKGLSLARGELIWIAEADDLATSSFLSTLAPNFADKSVALSVSGSRAIDSDGQPDEVSYREYFDKIFVGALASDFVQDASEFAKQYLSQRNALVNVSAILWRKDALTRAFESTETLLPTFKLAGDWLLYLAACAHGGRIAYHAAELNLHRRHARGVTSQTAGLRQIKEVSRVHDYFKSQFGADDRMQEAQRAYCLELEEQFGAANLNT
jgi:glycosyltransferase involved in cell wall biosynthesis